MVLVKTPAGQEALKDRHGSLSSRQRSAFILFDGKRTTGEVLAATAAMGITQDDVQAMIAQGLLAPVGGQTPAAAASPLAGPAAAALAEAPATDLGTVASPVEGSGRSPMERYKAAYPIATELTAGQLGLILPVGCGGVLGSGRGGVGHGGLGLCGVGQRQAGLGLHAPGGQCGQGCVA